MENFSEIKKLGVFFATLHVSIVYFLTEKSAGISEEKKKNF